MENHLQAYTTTIERALSSFSLPQNPSNLYDPLRYFLTLGGKRIRPVLTLMGATLFGKNQETALPAALAVELFHNFSLIHDDIMDEAPLRRAKETVHEKWNTNIAILSGDVLLVKAYQELAKQDPRHIPKLLDIFNRTAVEVCEGQQMDMDFETSPQITIDAYIEMIRLKTSVLLGCALQMGAIIADASPEDSRLVYEFGQNLGISFQIQDDLLDLYADADKFGKQVGGDIIANKKTILVLKALELATPMQKEFFLNAMQLDNPSQKVELVKQVFGEIGVKEAVIELRDAYFDKALLALQAIQRSEEDKNHLLALANFLKDRDV